MMLPALGEAGAVDRDRLADEDLNVLLDVVVGTGRDGLQAVDVAVVVRPEQLDLLGEAAVLLGEVVGGGGGKVGDPVAMLPVLRSLHPHLRGEVDVEATGLDGGLQIGGKAAKSSSGVTREA